MRVLCRSRVAAIESAGEACLAERVSQPCAYNIVAQHERGLDHVSERGHLRVAEHQLEEREISEKVACLIPNLPERNLPMF